MAGEAPQGRMGVVPGIAVALIARHCQAVAEGQLLRGRVELRREGGCQDRE